MISPLEIVVIAAIAMVFLLFGPKKIPELAKSLGIARKEFTNASGQPLTSILDAASGSADPSITRTTSSSSSDNSLNQTASRLGIETAGKTAEQISQEILQKADSRPGL